jgi:hypothetical protein
MSEIEILMGNELIELARTTRPGSAEAREIVRAAVDGDPEAVDRIEPYLDIARDYVARGQI